MRCFEALTLPCEVLKTHFQFKPKLDAFVFQKLIRNTRQAVQRDLTPILWKKGIF